MPKKRYTPEEIVAGCGVLVSQGQNIADAIRLTLDKLILACTRFC
jgi:hypothetical protein